MNYQITRMMNWWGNKSFSRDKGGSFNLQHYLKVCEYKLNNPEDPKQIKPIYAVRSSEQHLVR
jgi:hypothetical protein